MNSRRAGLALCLAVLALGACGRDNREPRIETHDTPAPPGSVFPSLVARDDRVLLSWTEPAGDDSDTRIRFAELNAGTWRESETIGSGDLFVNWADFPSLVLDADGSVGAQWLVRGGGASFAYGIRFAVRGTDARWTEPSIPHGRDRAAEHGFVSLLSDAAGSFELAWLDGREMEHGGEMELRFATWTDGEFQPDSTAPTGARRRRSRATAGRSGPAPSTAPPLTLTSVRSRWPGLPRPTTNHVSGPNDQAISGRRSENRYGSTTATRWAASMWRRWMTGARSSPGSSASTMRPWSTFGVWSTTNRARSSNSAEPRRTEDPDSHAWRPTAQRCGPPGPKRVVLHKSG